MDGERLGKRYNNGEDIISRLPDDVLSHIISRLEAKDAVKICVLSSRFKNVWTLIYNLRFNLTRAGYEGNLGTSFVNFVKFVLRRCQSNIIQNFHLKINYDLQESDAACLTKLICFVVGRNVCSLKLKFNVEIERPMIRIPQSILTCKSLVRLSLGFSDFVLDIPDCAMYFPCLKSLSIYVNRPNNNLMQKLFCSCPMLEELKIKGCNDRDRNVLTFDINVPTLKKLKIYLMADDNEYILVHRFVVRARNLEYLHVRNDFSACSVLGETPFLNKVILDCKDNVEELYGSPTDEATDRATEFFRAISSTRFLSLDVTLVHGPAKYYDEDQVVYYELECDPSCMLVHLKEIYLFCMDWNYQDREVIKFLLENSKVLERFSFHTCEIIGDEEEMQDEILNFPRASPICEIEFFDYDCKEQLRSEFHKYR